MRHRARLETSLLAIAAMIVAVPSVLYAQSFDGAGVIVAGAGAITTGGGTTIVAADSPGMVIDWTPTDTGSGGPINFQPVGTSALFTNRNAASFTVLNRIIPTDPSRPIVFNGTVTSQLVDLATGAARRGGALFFYSPGGILVSSTGAFNVGSLVLSASDLAYDRATGTFDTGGSFKFLPANAGARVEVQSGASITAGPINAYVALVAPKVINAGTITVDGSAVIVAADASTITFRPNALFDIQIDQGSSATGEAVTQEGTTIVSAGAINAAQRVYVVAVPKNDAITLAIKGTRKLSFDVAGAAGVDGNAIVLSAGLDVSFGAIASTLSSGGALVPPMQEVDGLNAALPGATGQASLVVEGGSAADLGSPVGTSDGQGPAAAPSDTEFVSVAGMGSILDISGDLTVRSPDADMVSGTTANTPVQVSIEHGGMTVQGADAAQVGLRGGGAAIGDLPGPRAAAMLGQSLAFLLDGRTITAAGLDFQAGGAETLGGPGVAPDSANPGSANAVIAAADWMPGAAPVLTGPDLVRLDKLAAKADVAVTAGTAISLADAAEPVEGAAFVKPGDSANSQ